MSPNLNFEAYEITEETNWVMKNFFKLFEAMFITGKETPYSIDKKNGNDPSKLKRLLNKQGNCYIRSLVQCLYKLGYTIEIRIVPRKMRNGSGAQQTPS